LVQALVDLLGQIVAHKKITSAMSELLARAKVVLRRQTSPRSMRVGGNPHRFHQLSRSRQVRNAALVCRLVDGSTSAISQRDA
jgi:hypothetical protein